MTLSLVQDIFTFILQEHLIQKVCPAASITEKSLTAWSIAARPSRGTAPGASAGVWVRSDAPGWARWKAFCKQWRGCVWEDVGGAVGSSCKILDKRQ